MVNLIICSKCQALLIIEEINSHKCNHSFRFEGDYLLIRRKGYWKKIHLPSLDIFPSTEKKQVEDSTDKETEPQFHIKVLMYYAA